MAKQVYAIGGETGLIKLGKSKDPDRRLCDLQSGSPVELSLIDQAPEAETINEKDLHKLFACRRKHGEWFDLDRETIQIVFSGGDRISQLMKMNPRALSKIVKAYDAESMVDCIRLVRDSSEWFWMMAVLWSSRGDGGGKRAGAGRKPALAGTKKATYATKLNPVVVKYLRQSGNGAVAIETAVMNSKAFKDWINSK